MQNELWLAALAGGCEAIGSVRLALQAPTRLRVRVGPHDASAQILLGAEAARHQRWRWAHAGCPQVLAPHIEPSNRHSVAGLTAECPFALNEELQRPGHAQRRQDLLHLAHLREVVAADASQLVDQKLCSVSRQVEQSIAPRPLENREQGIDRARR